MKRNKTYKHRWKDTKKKFFFSFLGWVKVTTEHHLAIFWCPTISHRLSPPQKQKLEFLPAPGMAELGENPSAILNGDPGS